MTKLNYTNLIKTGETTHKITRHETLVDAIISAWEEKMQGNPVKVISDETCETLYK